MTKRLLALLWALLLLPATRSVAETGEELTVLSYHEIADPALAMGGSNQMIFLITALFIGQGDILGQASAAVPLLIVGVLSSWAAAPAACGKADRTSVTPSTTSPARSA